jgi:hypothetical protein
MVLKKNTKYRRGNERNSNFSKVVMQRPELNTGRDLNPAITNSCNLFFFYLVVSYIKCNFKDSINVYIHIYITIEYLLFM